MKKLPLLVACLLFGAVAFGEPLPIFSRRDARLVGTATAPADSAPAAFWSAYRRDRTAATPYEAGLPLINPPAWGKTVSTQTAGVVRYHRQFAGGFVCHLALHDLLPNHAYLLTLNGNPEKAGNDLLPSPVPGNEAEKYYDFLDVKTDARGAYEADLGVFLKPGRYDVRLYVKDAADFKIVLYRDFFRFAVE